MMTSSIFYQARVDEALRDAAEAGLANVRDRCLRAAAAWEIMAQHASRMDRHRADEATRRALRDETVPIPEGAVGMT
jgi:hypothetical protein